jgi:hypothetical protein
MFVVGEGDSVDGEVIKDHKSSTKDYQSAEPEMERDHEPHSRLYEVFECRWDWVLNISLRIWCSGCFREYVSAAWMREKGGWQGYGWFCIHILAAEGGFPPCV